MIDTNWLREIREQFDQPLEYPGGMGPQLTYGRHHVPPMCGYRRAAVLILLSPDSPISTEESWRDVAWELTLTTRASNMAQHAGQVCFPGGRQEAGETELECATREWGEELGPLPDCIHAIGSLPDLYVFASDHWVRPIVAISPEVPCVRVNPAEVESSFSLPLSELRDWPRSQLTIRRGGLSFESPQYETAHGGIWGATAMMLELIAQVWQRRPE